jgi:hypothetical protein
MSNKGKSKPQANSLFQTAFQEGSLSEQSLQALTIVDIGAEIEAGLGVSVDQIQSSEVVLVTMMVDDSGSIRFAGNGDTVRVGHNEVLKSLLNSRQSHSMLAHTCYLNGTILFPYIPLAVPDRQGSGGKLLYVPNPQLVFMDANNYDPCQGTPLYDETVVLLGRVLAKFQEFTDNGVHARTITMIITDGADEHSRQQTARSVRSLVEDMLGENHIISAMGIDNGTTDFRKVFHEMGIPDSWILLPGNSASEVRKAFQLFSQSAVRASRPTAVFTSLGGFGSC